MKQLYAFLAQQAKVYDLLFSILKHAACSLLFGLSEVQNVYNHPTKLKLLN